MENCGILLFRSVVIYLLPAKSSLLDVDPKNVIFSDVSTFPTRVEGFKLISVLSSSSLSQRETSFRFCYQMNIKF